MTIGGRRFLLSLAIVAASLCLALGVSLPFVQLTGLFTHEYSLITAVSALIRSSQYLLGAVVLIFGIFLPVMKLLYLLLLALLPLRDIDRLGRQLHALDWLGRWSLHDVVALVLTILLIQRQGAYDAAADSGLYAFTAAVMLTLLACTWLRSDVVALRLRAPAPKAAYASAMGGLAFVLAAALLALGVMLPAIRLPGGYAGTDQHSLATLIWALYGQQERFACAVIAVLAVLLPGIKLLSLLVLIVSRRLPYWIRARSVSATAWLGGYAIADVMVLALMAFYLGAPGRAGASVLPGAYCFAASALITMLAYGWANSPAPTTVQHTSLAERLAGVASAETSARR